jgi:tetratricopeptide (TPR) repeat protein
MRRYAVSKFQRQGVLFVSLVLSFFAALYFFGCTATQTAKVRTPEEKKAYQDSLDQEHKKKLQLQWSFGYEPFKQGDYERAKGYFRKVAELDTGGVFGRVLYQRLGRCYLELGQVDSAEYAYQMGIHNRPDDPYNYKMMIYIKEQSRNFEGALPYAVKLTEIEPDSASNFKKLGEINLNVDNPDAAIEAYQTAVKLDPSDNEAQTTLAKLVSTYLDLDQLIITLRNAVNEFPDDMKKRTELAGAYLKAGEPSKSVEQLTVVTQKEPQNVYALEYLGESYQQLEQYSSAVSTYIQILDIKPDDKKNMCNLALSYRSLKQFSTAMRHANKALAIDSKYGLAYLTRGMIYEAAADYCVDQNPEKKIGFDDKLVYKLSYDEYVKAKSDLNWSTDASNRITYVEPLIPTKSDYFMNKNVTMPRSACYDWIQ